MVHAFVTKTSASKRRMACQKHSLNWILYFVFCISLLLQPYLHFTTYHSTSSFHSTVYCKQRLLFVHVFVWSCIPSVLWHCWLGGRKGVRPVIKLSGGVLAWLFVLSDGQICIWPSWCHCHSLSLASVKSRLVLPFWYRLTRIVSEKGPLNGCVCVCVCLYVVVLYCLCCRMADHDDQGLLLASRMMCYSASCIYPSHHVSVTQCQHRRTWEREHFGPAYVLKKAASREHCDTAMLKKSMLQGDTWVWANAQSNDLADVER